MGLERVIMDRVIREVLIGTTLDGVINKVSPNSLYVLGYTQEEMIGVNIMDFILENKNVIERSHSEVIFKNSQGNHLYLDITKESSMGESETGILFSIIDISRYKDRHDRALRLLNTIERTNDIIYSFDIKQMKFTYLSPSIMTILGYPIEDYMNNPLLEYDITHPDDFELMMKKITGELDYSKPTATRFLHKIGYYVWLEDYITPVYNSDNELVAIEGVARNIQERKELEFKLEYLSFHDGLTGLYNRAYYEIRIEQLNKDQDSRIGLILCDLDNLKIINDTLGHEEGDNLIKNSVTLLVNSINNGTIARIGGDEFIILLEDIDYNFVEATELRIKKSIYDYNFNNTGLPVKVSMGLSYIESSIGNMDIAFKNADSNMYKEKRSHKAQKN